MRYAQEPAHLPRDMRQTDAYQRVQTWFERVHGPVLGQPSHLHTVALDSTGTALALTVDVREALDQRAKPRAGLLIDGRIELVEEEGGSQVGACLSAHDGTMAWLSDHETAGRFGLRLRRPSADVAVDGPPVEGTAEHVSFSPDGRRILLVVAQPGAEKPSAAGSGRVVADDELPSWMPGVEGPRRAEGWRRAVVLDLVGDCADTVGSDGVNVWASCWKGSDQLLAVCSDNDPGEGAWYTADVRVLDISSGADHVVYQPRNQVGAMACSPDGRRCAVVEGFSSDRGIVAGAVQLIDADGTRTVDTADIDVTDLQWIDDHRLGIAGLRGLHAVVGHLDVDAQGSFQEIFVEQLGGLCTTGRRYPSGAWRSDGTLVAMHSAYDVPPRIVEITPDGARTTELVSLRHEGHSVVIEHGGRTDAVSWSAPDGHEIQGLLTVPEGQGPFPMVVCIHGGPAWAWQHSWEMHYGLTPLLVANGFAVLHPNPRGSTGRGEAFARLIVGDIGGSDALDLRTGAETMVSRGIADPDRLCLTGGSYGGFMAAWLVTQDTRWAASVPVSPVTDWYSQHHTSNLQAWDGTYLDHKPRGTGLYHHRSPLFHADTVATPVLQFAGLQDACTPPTQAVELHRALQEVGVETHLVLYPEEGHGVQGMPALIDHWARILAFFTHHAGRDHDRLSHG